MAPAFGYAITHPLLSLLIKSLIALVPATYRGQCPSKGLGLALSPTDT